MATDSGSETDGSLRVSTRIAPSSSARHELGADERQRPDGDRSRRRRPPPIVRRPVVHLRPRGGAT
ncbi:MAG: hypothetical protein MZV64_43315 [Ignavibacteriales bacterium]|nr:hypothetical protein [Ignavibacteriales bacterium]